MASDRNRSSSGNGQVEERDVLRGQGGSGNGVGSDNGVPAKRLPDDTGAPSGSNGNATALLHREKPASVVERLVQRAKSKSVSPPIDPEVQETCPLFWELISLDRYDQERDRYLPELSLTRVEGGWECVIRDIETSQETRFGFEAFSELPRAAEKHLSSPKGIWKPFKNRKNQKGIERHDKKKS